MTTPLLAGVPWLLMLCLAIGPATLVNSSNDAAEYTEASRPDELATTPEFVWTPSEDPRQKCPKFTWVNQQETEHCLAGTWIAFWGDSTTRMTFSALVDFLGGGIETTDLPTHDFTYKEHWSRYDHCDNHCHMALHFPKHDILLTFNFVTNIAKWPDLNKTLDHYTDPKVFPELVHASPRSQPDLVIMNSGPWEYYRRDAPTKATNDAYVELLRTFLTKNFGADSRTNLIVARNTACPQHKGMCDMSKVPCLDAMDNMHRIQDRVISEFAVQDGDVQNGRVRYVGGMYTKIVPEGYQCAGEAGFQTGFHLPGVITDMRLNHALHAVCRK